MLHSRVARSLSFALVKMGAEVTLVGPPTLIPPDAPAWGVQVSHDIGAVLPKLDVCYMLRVQRERQRQQYFPASASTRACSVCRANGPGCSRTARS